MQYYQSLFGFIANQTILDVWTSISCANVCMSSLGHECRTYAYDKMTSTCLISAMNVYAEPGKNASTTSYNLFSIPYTGNHSWQFFHNANVWLFCNMTKTFVKCRALLRIRSWGCLVITSWVGYAIFYEYSLKLPAWNHAHSVRSCFGIGVMVVAKVNYRCFVKLMVEVNFNQSVVTSVESPTCNDDFISS